MATHKQEYPPLLGAGFHPMSMDELRDLCVAAFQHSTIRPDIMAGFEIIHERALAVGIEGEIWVDGSFLTHKMDPQDIDFIFVIRAHFHESGTPEQHDFVEWLISREDDPKKSFLCHTDVVLIYLPGSPWYPLTVNTLRHWDQAVYGYSVHTREPKGIVVVKLEQPSAGEQKEVPK